MALFRNKKPAEHNVADAMAELHRAQALAQQSTSQVASQTGMDMQALMRSATEATQGGGMEQMMAYRNRAARVYQRGVEMPATLHTISLGQPSPMLGGVPAQVQLSVEPPDGLPYRVSTDQVMEQSSALQFAPGQRIIVKVDPDDPQCLLIWGSAAPPSAPPPAEDRSARLAKLHDLLTAGVLSSDEFEAQKAKMLAE